MIRSLGLGSLVQRCWLKAFGFKVWGLVFGVRGFGVWEASDRRPFQYFVGLEFKGLRV